MALAKNLIDINGNPLHHFYDMYSDAIEIPQNADLNTDEYGKPGVYVCSSTDTVQTLKHCPPTSRFTMIVEDNGETKMRTIYDYWGNYYRQGFIDFSSTSNMFQWKGIFDGLSACSMFAFNRWHNTFVARTDNNWMYIFVPGLRLLLNKGYTGSGQTITLETGNSITDAGKMNSQTLTVHELNNTATGFEVITALPKLASGSFGGFQALVLSGTVDGHLVE